jgi:hypothetical protein
MNCSFNEAYRFVKEADVVLESEGHVDGDICCGLRMLSEKHVLLVPRD